MAKSVNLTVEDILAASHTGLEGEELKAFTAFCACELGNIKKLAGDDTFASFKLSGKGDKAKGVYGGARVEFKGGHNAATLVIHFVTQALKSAESLGVLPPTVDVSIFCKAWAERRRKSADKSVSKEAGQPA